MLTRHKSCFGLGPIALALMMAIGLSSMPGSSNAIQAAPPPRGSVARPAVPAIGSNLLHNPGFDDDRFYFRDPMSYVANGWFDWFAGPNVPQFVDGGDPQYNHCYPEPGYGQACDGNSQGLILQDLPYTAGIWQPVTPITPCLDYRFQGLVRLDYPNYQPRLGINPLGWQLPARDNDYHCPDDPATLCHKEALANFSDMPASTIWSSDIRPAAFTWTPISVIAEALTTTITVWTYTSPHQQSLQSTYWDQMSLEQVPKQTLVPDGVIPAADGTIGAPAISLAATSALFRWTTVRPSLSQVFYRLHSMTLPSPPASLPYVTHLPLVPGSARASFFAYHTDPTSALVTNQSAQLGGLRPNTAYDYVLLSRGFNGATCTSSASATGVFTTTR